MAREEQAPTPAPVAAQLETKLDLEPSWFAALEQPRAKLNALAIAPNGDLLLASEEGEVGLFARGSGKLVAYAQICRIGPGGLMFTSEQEALVSCPGQITTLSIPGLELGPLEPDPPYAVNRHTVFTDERVGISSAGRNLVWTREGFERVDEFEIDRNELRHGLALSPEGKSLALTLSYLPERRGPGEARGELFVRDLETKQMRSLAQDDALAWAELTFSNDGRWLYAWTSGSFRRYELQSGAEASPPVWLEDGHLERGQVLRGTGVVVSTWEGPILIRDGSLIPEQLPMPRLGELCSGSEAGAQIPNLDAVCARIGERGKIGISRVVGVSLDGRQVCMADPRSIVVCWEETPAGARAPTSALARASSYRYYGTIVAADEDGYTVETATQGPFGGGASGGLWRQQGRSGKRNVWQIGTIEVAGVDGARVTLGGEFYHHPKIGEPVELVLHW